MKNIVGILVDVENDVIVPMAIEDDIETYYRILNCDCIDITMRTIGGRAFDIVCDDEGLLKAHPKVSAFNKAGEPMLVGNLFLCHHEGEELSSITEDDVKHISKHVGLATRGDEVYRCLGDVDYYY